MSISLNFLKNLPTFESLAGFPFPPTPPPPPPPEFGRRRPSRHLHVRGRLPPIASVTDLILLLVYDPPQAAVSRLAEHNGDVAGEGAQGAPWNTWQAVDIYYLDLSRCQGLFGVASLATNFLTASKKTMLLTSWDQFAENKGATIANMISTTPVITALQVKVSLYNNLSLSTKGISCIITEPDLRQAAMLRTW
ncbi:hypothetical protein TIFTF001_018094 [Ficus carica]|uniref:Uncharacterized protein n=1 Tax=Ficus carica TaxID=3494 RepID=A0AA88D8Y3_FICCA|nr:hypothetical protein TIFTF001_018094 [Ficus carica]